MRSPEVHLPPRHRLVMTNEDDPVDYYYKPFTGWLYRRRLAMGLALLGERHYGRILEIGYGSGILLPALAARCDELHAIDLHPNLAPVQAMLVAEGVQAQLATGSILALDYPDGFFDGVVCLSVLEHLQPAELTLALGHIRRVLRPGGAAALGFPVRNATTNLFYRVVGFDPAELHPSAHHDIIAAAQTALGRPRVVHFPAWLPIDLALYVGVQSDD